MSDDKPKPLDDVKKGLGLLYRAAKNTVEKLPTKDIEEAVVTSAKEVGRALESVGKTIEREVFGEKDGAAPKAKPDDAPAGDKPKADEPTGKRVDDK
jgi:hypothetical protein